MSIRKKPTVLVNNFLCGVWQFKHFLQPPGLSDLSSTGKIYFGTVSHNILGLLEVLLSMIFFHVLSGSMEIFWQNIKNIVEDFYIQTTLIDIECLSEDAPQSSIFFLKLKLVQEMNSSKYQTQGLANKYKDAQKKSIKSQRENAKIAKVFVNCKTGSAQ